MSATPSRTLLERLEEMRGEPITVGTIIKVMELKAEAERTGADKDPEVARTLEVYLNSRLVHSPPGCR